jgi:hypothetical protein
MLAKGVCVTLWLLRFRFLMIASWFDFFYRAEEAERERVRLEVSKMN